MPRIAIVAASLWDLRAQAEEQMRGITDAQRVIDHYNDNPHSQEEAKRRLLADFDALLKVHANVGEALQDCGSVIAQLPTGGTPDEAAPHR